MTNPRNRFGAFELDRSAGELRKHGVKVPLSGQPLDVLALLAARPGEVVTREELKEALWPQQTFVDFDNGVNTAVRRIRQALDDSATNPQFIETLPKRGYRFIAQLKPGKSAVLSVQAAPAVADGGVGSEVSQPRSRRFGWAVIAAAVTIAALAGWWTGARTTDAPGAPRYQLTQLTFDGGLTYQPTVSPDGKFVAYASDRAGEGNLDIWVQQIGRESSKIRLTTNPADDVEPDFSPDGQTVAFYSLRDGGGLYVTPSLGGPEKLVAPHGMGPKFSPDGSKIAYWVGDRNGMSDVGARATYGNVMTVSPTGRSPVVLAEDFAFARRPVWLDDGSGLLFEGSPTPEDPRGWWTVSLDGRGRDVGRPTPPAQIRT